MKLLKKRILDSAIVLNENVLKVDNFLNHLIDIELANEIGKEFAERFKNKKITKILTIEASGIGISCVTAQYFGVPVLFAKKQDSINMETDKFVSQVHSFTKNRDYHIFVSKKYLLPEDHVLIIDDFLANGSACKGLIDIVRQSKATLEGIGIVIEKEFQHGRSQIQDKEVQIESLAIISSLKNNQVEFK